MRKMINFSIKIKFCVQKKPSWSTLNFTIIRDGMFVLNEFLT